MKPIVKGRTITSGELKFELRKITLYEDEVIKLYRRNHFWVWINTADDYENSDWYYTAEEAIQGCVEYLYGRTLTKDWGWCYNEETAKKNKENWK